MHYKLTIGTSCSHARVDKSYRIAGNSREVKNSFKSNTHGDFLETNVRLTALQAFQYTTPTFSWRSACATKLTNIYPTKLPAIRFYLLLP